MQRRFFIPLSVVCGFIFLSGVLGMLGNGRSPVLAAPAATTWYVDVAGDDNDTCLTPAAACATVAAAAGKAADGDAVIIAAGVYEEELDLSQVLTITGAGPDHTILDGANSHRILQTSGVARLTISDLTFRHGRITGAAERGGAIYNLGTLLLQNVTVYSSTAETGGGGIFNSGALTLRGSRVLSNSSEGGGGGLYGWNFGTFTVTESVIAGNSASQGGGIFSSSPFSLQDTTVRDNEAATFGGGLAIYAGPTTLNRVSVYGNQTSGYGAGVLVNAGVVTLTNVTVSDNTGDSWSGIANISSGAEMMILNSTVAYNVDSGAGVDFGGIGNVNDAVITLQNSIVAHNDGRNCVNSGSWTSLGHNLSSDDQCEFTASGDLQNVDPRLAPLADYGGPTWSHALAADSVAVDGGDNAACPAADQRGVSRPVDGDHDGTAVCDIGAYETRAQLTVSDAVVSEGNAGTSSAVFTVTLAPTSTQPVTVAYATVDGAATAGDDYVAAAGALTFSPGQATRLVSIDVNGDEEDEPDETFTLALSDAVNADIVDGRGQGTIIDDDGLSSLTINDVTVDEGDNGTVNAIFTVSLSPAAAQTVSVDYATGDGGAEAGDDYLAAAGALTFDPGETGQTIEVAVIGDEIDEASGETFFVHLSNAGNANLGDAQGEGTINDDETAQVSLRPGPEIEEGDSGVVPAVFTVTLSAPAAFPVSVDYATSSVTGEGFAAPGVDYEPISGTLTFAPGATAQTVTVMVIGDMEEEPDETFTMRLSNPDPIEIYGAVSIGHIRDDDAVPTDPPALFLPLITGN